MKWLSLHVFYYTNRLYLISKLLPDFFKIIIEEDFAKKFFYIVYDEKGPHIRIRILCENDKFETCMNFSIKYIDSFLHKYPSGTADIIMAAEWYANNSVQIIDYEPEIERYGGLDCIHIAESNFMYSSIVTLSILQTGYKNYIKNFVSACLLHVLFINIIFDGDYLRIKHFFKYAYQFRYNNIQAERFFIKYEENILSSISKFRRKLNDGCVKEPILNEWLTYVHIIVNELSKTDLANNNMEDVNLWKVLLSYFHMTNNRLGIQSLHEEYIYFFILKDILVNE